MADIYLYGTFADDTYTDDQCITLESFKDDLSKINGQYDVHIDSMGGLVETGAAIFNILENDENYRNCYIDGCCASIATLIPCASHSGKTFVHEDDVFMIHEVKMLFPTERAMSHHQLTELSTDLRESTKEIAEIYSEKTGKDVHELLQLMEEETWLEGGQNIIDFGFADELVNDEEKLTLTASAKQLRMVASLEYAKEHYKHVPKSLQTLNKSYIHITGKTKEVMNGMDEEKKTTSTDAPTPEKKEEEQKEITTVEDLAKAYPELVEELKKQIIEELQDNEKAEPETEDKADNEPEDEAFEDGEKKTEDAVKEALAKERKRLKELDEIAWAVDEKTLEKAKYESSVNAKDLFFEVGKRDEKLKKAFSNKEKADYKNSGAEDVETLPANTMMVDHEPSEEEKTISLNEQINKLYEEAKRK